ncbi:MAG TPA: hypothetical protein VH741_11090 [Candidatus Limnocylindrales bacterium]
MPGAPAAASPPRAPAQALVGRLDPAGVRPTIVLAVFLGALFFGSQVVNSAIPLPAAPPGATAGPDGRPASSVDLGELTVQVPAGWQLTDGPVGPRLARGSVAIDIGSLAFNGDATSLYNAFVSEVLAPNATGLSATQPALVQVGPGVPAVRGIYTGIFGEGGQVEGHVTALVVDGTGYVFDAWGLVGTLRPLLPDVELVTDTLVVNR